MATDNKDFKVKNGLIVGDSTNLVNYDSASPSNPFIGQIWIDPNSSASAVDVSNYLLVDTAVSTYLPITASSNYVQVSNASATYLTRASASAIYATKTNFSETAWTSYTPTITADLGGFSLGNGTLTGRYKQLGKTVFFHLKFIYGSTSSAGSGHWNFSLPVTAYDINFNFIASILDNGIAWYSGIGNGNYTGSTTSFAVITPSTNSSLTTWVAVDNGIPFSWGTGDNITISGSYEAA